VELRGVAAACHPGDVGVLAADDRVEQFAQAITPRTW
jgi:hypothetical protein